MLLSSVSCTEEITEPGETRALNYVIVGTDQDKCYDNGGEIACPEPGEPYYGQDAQYQGVQPTYQDNGDGTVTDFNTGLMWQKTPPTEYMTWGEAHKYAESLALGDYDDWRVPTIKELHSIVAYTGNVHERIPYLDASYFDYATPGMPIASWTWSDTTYAQPGEGDRADNVGHPPNLSPAEGELGAFQYNFADGHIKTGATGFMFDRVTPAPYAARFLVRCVRGDIYGENNLADKGDGTVTDLATGLMWQKADDGVARNWEGSLEYAESLTLAGYGDWRLPNAKELHSIVDYSRVNPAIDPIFTTTDGMGWFWTSTTHGDFVSQAAYIAFGEATTIYGVDIHGSGALRSDPKSGDPANYSDGLGIELGYGPDEVRIYNYVRCVRNAN